jgi:hypothetical protein
MKNTRRSRSMKVSLAVANYNAALPVLRKILSLALLEKRTLLISSSASASVSDKNSSALTPRSSPISPLIVSYSFFDISVKKPAAGFLVESLHGKVAIISQFTSRFESASLFLSSLSVLPLSRRKTEAQKVLSDKWF